MAVSSTFGDDGIPTDTYLVMLKSGTSYTVLFFDTATGKYHTGTDSVTAFLSVPASQQLDTEFAANCVAGGLGDFDFVDAAGNVIAVTGTEAFIPPDLAEMVVTETVAEQQQAQQQPQQQAASGGDQRNGFFQWLRPQTQPTPPGGNPRFAPPTPIPSARERIFGGPTLILPNNPLRPRYWQHVTPGFMLGFRF